MRRTLPTLIAAALMVALVGLAIASNRSSTRATGAVLSSPVTELPAAPRTSAVADTVGEPTGRVLAEMTRRLGTPRGVAFSHRRRAAQYRRLQARIRAAERAAAAAEARRRAAATAAATAARSTAVASSGSGAWVDPQAAAVANSNPSSPSEQSWLQGGYGGWVEASGFARAPVNAPPAIKRIIQAGNQIARSPYIWGGGHGQWQDRGYDCSGSVSYALAAGGLLGYTQTSGQLMNWGSPGPGRWLTIYANQGHVFMYVAGLRFDTSGRAGDHSSRWQLAPRSADGFVARHYPGL